MIVIVISYGGKIIMRRMIMIFICLVFALSIVASGCGENKTNDNIVTENKANENNQSEYNAENVDDERIEDQSIIKTTTDIMKLEDGLSAVRFDGDYDFEEFLNQGGASSDWEVINFLISTFPSISDSFSMNRDVFGCSTIAVKSHDGAYLFGRNFDWNYCNALIVQSQPSTGYASISTVNTDFINGVGFDFEQLSDEIQAKIALYAPLDGMNERGLVVSVNMIQDTAKIEQNTNKPDLTTTTAIRLLLNQAATVEEAISLLEQYDLHASMGYMIHFAIADTMGNSVVLEYVDNKMLVVETPVVTNFYLAEGKKYGIGTSQSHDRYEILMGHLHQSPEMTMGDVREALSSVSKKNFGEFESTEWSIVFNQSSGLVEYYHRENFENVYIFSLN